MRDDVDRECCGSIKKMIMHGMSTHKVTKLTDSGVQEDQPHGWALTKETFHDPGMTLVFEHSSKLYTSNPKVAVKISWGEDDGGE